MKKVTALIGFVLAAVIFALNVSAGKFMDFSYKDIYGNTYYHSSGEVWEGYPDGKFHPEKVMTRAELIKCLYKRDEVNFSPDYGNQLFLPFLPQKTPLRHYDGAFSDVSPGDWYYDAVVWAYEYGIVKGRGERRFDPYSEINVFEYALIMYRYCEMRFDDEFWDHIMNSWNLYFIKDKQNYVYYPSFRPTGYDHTIHHPDLRDEFMNNLVLVDLPEWFSDEVGIEDLFKHDIWIGGDYECADMTRFSPTRGDIYEHFVFGYVDVYSGPS